MSRRSNEPVRAVKGMNDFLPASVPRKDVLPDSGLWLWFETCVRDVMARYGYQYLLTPVVEPTELFVRGLGEVTDIVEKEMYSFTDAMNGDRLTLRPEATAGIVRAMIEHNALHNGPLRLWTIGPMFRHERPQKGRYRQFHQLDVEALGSPGPDVDAELILLTRALWRSLGLAVGTHLRLELNSLGEPDERRAHRDALVAHFERHAERLDDDSRRRLRTNPLRILDSKNEAMQPMLEKAPKLTEFLGEQSLAHFDAVRATLDAAGLEYRVNPRLVRGLDYYNLTVFEWVTDQLGSQATVCGGGRYDGLFEQLGGKPERAVGFGLGIERLLLLVRSIGLAVPSQAPLVYAVVSSAAARVQAIAALEKVRGQGVAVVMHAGEAGMKAQFRKADASGARYALVFGDAELARGEVAVKPLRDREDEQRTISLPGLSDWARALSAEAAAPPRAA